MQKEKSSFFDIVKKLHCPKHHEPIVLVCIEKECTQSQRTFCLQCNDEAQINKNSHILISTKKFDAIYGQYKDVIKGQEANKEAKERFTKIKEKILNDLNQVESLICTNVEEDFIQGEEQQIMKGKLNNLLKNSLWTKVIDMKNNKLLEDQIYAQLNKENSTINKIALVGLTNLEKSIQLEMQIFKTALKTNQSQQKQSRYFSSERKHQCLKLSNDRKAVSNTSQFGHYFCLTQKDFDVYNPLFKFNIGKIDPNTSYWFGFTFPTLCQSRKWANIYDQGMGGFFVVIFDSGKKVNFWNHEKGGFKSSEEVNVAQIGSYASLQLFINFQTKQLYFNVEQDGKKTLIRSAKPQKWFGKIYPVVGFYGNVGTITLQ